MQQLATVMDFYEAKRDQPMLREGERSSHFLLILSGEASAKVSGNLQGAIYGTGSVLGHTALFYKAATRRCDSVRCPAAHTALKRERSSSRRHMALHLSGCGRCASGFEVAPTRGEGW